MKPQVAILVGRRGRGSNMEALVRAMQAGQVGAEPLRVISTSPDSPALARARDLGVEAIATDDLAGALEGADWLCLAGYLSLLPREVIDKLHGRILNIHPALLPKFGGKGMYGHRVHEAVIAAKEPESGCTVHWVTPVYDEGGIILQARCPVLPDDTHETLAARVLKLEHVAYPEALAKVIRDG